MITRRLLQESLLKSFSSIQELQVSEADASAEIDVLDLHHKFECHFFEDAELNIYKHIELLRKEIA